METCVEIYDDKREDKSVESNHCHVFDRGLCTRKNQHGSCSDPRIFEQTEAVPSQPYQTQINNAVTEQIDNAMKKRRRDGSTDCPFDGLAVPYETQIDNAIKRRRCDGSTDCPFDRLPDDILHEILSRLSITELLRVGRTCVSWHRIISSCSIFHRLYDERNDESWIALTSDHYIPHDFCLLNNNSSKWYFFHSKYQEDQTRSWLLQGAADGLLLFVGNDGKMLVVNALTRCLRQLPDTQVTPRLCLESCMKKLKVWASDSISTPMTVQPSLSINIVVVDGGKTFRVIVWGELRTNQVHALVYSSATDKWSVRLCSNISSRFFRRPFHATVDGNNIIYSSMQRSVLANYDIETGLFNVNRIIMELRPLVLGMIVDRIQYIKMLVYKGRTFLLSVFVGRDINPFIEQSRGLMGLWLANPTKGQWELLTRHELQIPSDELAAAYDGKDSVTIIPKMQGSKMLSLNLDTKEWRVLAADTQAWKLPDENAENAAQQQIAFLAAGLRAFHFKLKFCTA